MAFLRMKLNTVNIGVLNHCCEVVSIMRDTEHGFIAVTNCVVLVYMIEALSFLPHRKQGVVLRRPYNIPPHVGDFYIVLITVKCNNIGRDPSQPRQHTFVTPATQQLHSQANTQYGDSTLEGQMVKHLKPTSLMYSLHACVEGSYTGEDKAPARHRRLWLRDHRGINPDRLEHTLDRTNVSDPAIDNCDFHAVNL